MKGLLAVLLDVAVLVLGPVLLYSNIANMKNQESLFDLAFSTIIILLAVGLAVYDLYKKTKTRNG